MQSRYCNKVCENRPRFDHRTAPVTSPFSFALAAFILLLAPGPTNALLWIGGAERGLRRGLPLVLAATAAYLLAIGLILLVLQPLLRLLPWLGDVLALSVAAYIAVLAARLWRQSGSTQPQAALVAPSRLFVVTLLNPKAFVLALSILPGQSPQLHWYLLALAGIILLVASAWLLLGVVVGAAAGARHERRLKRVSAAVLAGFAGLILWNVWQGFAS
jgi:threonine/homoserine/homoserine lactone efflux protein